MPTGQQARGLTLGGGEITQGAGAGVPLGRVEAQLQGGVDHRSGLNALGTPHPASEPDVVTHRITALIPMVPTPSQNSPLQPVATDMAMQNVPSGSARSSAPHRRYLHTLPFRLHSLPAHSWPFLSPLIHFAQHIIFPPIYLLLQCRHLSQLNLGIMHHQATSTLPTLPVKHPPQLLLLI